VLASMSLDDWVLALHVVSAFALVAGLVFFWVLVVAVRKADTPEETLRLGAPNQVAGASLGIGAVGTLALGLWLAFSVGNYAVWDGWIVAALVLWVVAMALGSRTNAAFSQGAKKAQELRAAGQNAPSAELLALNRTASGVALQALTSLAVLLALLDMIFKPGA
jgi:uncharacterized membrane protein